MSNFTALKTWTKQLIRARLLPWLLESDLLLTRTVARQSLLGFLDAVSPVATNHKLIRIGGDGDGGYLVPDDLIGIKVCFSPGVSEVADFELALAALGIQCFLADYSVDVPPKQHPLFTFDKKFLGATDDDVFIRLETWLRRAPDNDNDMILQMDIEGAEYGVILNASDAMLARFRILVVEFHELQGLTDKLGFELINLTFQKLLRQFDIVHIHPNNCRRPVVFNECQIPPVMEFTFLRKDRVAARAPASIFPHSLDRRNLPDVDDISLPGCWFDRSLRSGRG